MPIDYIESLRAALLQHTSRLTNRLALRYSVMLGNAIQRRMPRRHGEVSEWLKEAVLKTVEPRGSVGSNPTFSGFSCGQL